MGEPGHGTWQVRAVGAVRSGLIDIDAAPRQGDEGAPAAWVELFTEVAAAADGVAVGDRLVLLTWLDRADRTVTRVHPRGDATLPLTGVFATRSPHRPNPVGLHPVTVTARDGLRLRVEPLEAVDGTPVIDIKVALGPPGRR
jgi:tRNA-Thr(GGU) m(6)t(6)A37 methyltransferase TsaA